MCKPKGFCFSSLNGISVWLFFSKRISNLRKIYAKKTKNKQPRLEGREYFEAQEIRNQIWPLFRQVLFPLGVCLGIQCQRFDPKMFRSNPQNM